MRDTVFYKIKSGDMVELSYDGMCYQIDKVYTINVFLDSPESQYVTVKKKKGNPLYGPFGVRLIKNIL